MAKAQLEFQVAGTAKDNKNSFLIYVNSERRRDNTVPLLDEAGHLTNCDVDRAERFNAFFAPVFIAIIIPGSQSLESWKVITGGNINFQLALNLFVTC